MNYLRYSRCFLGTRPTSSILFLNPVRFYSSDLKWPSHKVRNKYLEYFCIQHNHKFLASSSVLPKKGSGTYFTNSGMNQFKSIILGEVQANEIINFEKYQGVTNSQKCIRIGGKHSDLDDIGTDTYHHTFFEMLGNWSFGNYGKERSCGMALDLLVNVYGLNVNGLYFTYFGGDSTFGLEPDFETKNIWLKLGVKEDKLLPFGMRENFWEMDTVGPCGPCTEIHYDRLVTDTYTPEQAEKAKNLVNAGTEQVIELWNLVFMQYNRLNKKNFACLPSFVIDTGMGLERLTAVLNGLESNYETDLFTPLFDRIHKYCGDSGNSGVTAFNEANANAYGYKVLADHMRSISFSISDGLMPSRNGLGGFLKYLILKNIKICKTNFQVDNGAELMCELVPLVIDSFKGAYPEIINKSEYIQKVIKHTDKRQHAKIKNSTQVAERYLKKQGNPSHLRGEQVWKLFKGDGSGEEISIEFITEFCENKNISLDLDKFEKIYLNENENSLKKLKMQRKDNSGFIELATQLKKFGVPATDDSCKYAFQMDPVNMEATYKMTGNVLESKLLSIASKGPDSKFSLVDSVKCAEGSNEYFLILDKTCFYPESGGQMADEGTLTLDKDIVFHVTNVKHIQGFSFHIGKLLSNPGDKKIQVGDSVMGNVNGKIRFNTANNHTAVHLLNHAVRKHFGMEDSIIQLSSNVRNTGLKFEFSFSERLEKPTSDDIAEIEKIMKDLIKKQLPIYSIESANLDLKLRTNSFPLRKLKDILYPLKVRVVSMGSEWTDDELVEEDSSAELCCGTHASNTGQLKEIVVRSFSPNGDSSFEIDACTGDLATEALQNDAIVLNHLTKMSELFNFKKNLDSTSSAEENYQLNQIADRSIQIENIFKSKPVSYTVLHHVKQESMKYRPSKRQLQTALENYFAKELSKFGAETSNVLTISTMDSKIVFKFLAFESVLTFDLVLKALKALKSISPLVIVYNKYRSNYILYSREVIEKGGEIEGYLDDVQEKIFQKNPGSFVVETKANYRVLKCKEVSSGRQSYFTF